MKYITKFSPFSTLPIAVICAFFFIIIDLAAAVTVLDPQYEIVTLTENTPLSGCNGAVIGADGALYVVHSGNGMVKLYVAEYGNGQITEVSLTDGAKRVVTGGLSGPIALTMVDGNLYIAESKVGRISKVDPATGNKEIFFVGVAGKQNAIGNDGGGNLIILDGANKNSSDSAPKTCLYPY